MIIHDVPQGTTEWKMARMGLPTASQFGRIIGKKGGILAGSDTYLHELVVESLLGFVEGEDNDWMARGREFEEQARADYELATGRDVRQVGFVTNDAGTIGCSPDGLVDPEGGVEFKVPAAKTHIGYLLGGDVGPYLPQVMGCLWLCEREWWDWSSFHQTLPVARVRVVRDDAYIKQLSAALDEFTDRLADAKARILGMGFVPSEGTQRTQSAIYGADSERL